MTLSIRMLNHCAECHYAECNVLFIATLKCFVLSVIMLNCFMLSVIMLSIIMLSVIMLNVIMLNVIMLYVVMLSALAPHRMPSSLMICVINAECSIFHLYD